jgi:BirA family transcriptional regulator, biotin operon repressor / biotin---[acetyl-CoA-carboxylase] ligase
VSVTLGHPRLHLRLIDSTNDRARALAIAGAPHGTLVTASQQTAGRGRQGRRWSAPADSSLLMSLVLRGSCMPRLLPLIAAVAVCDVAGEQAMIKWPNDIVLARQADRSGELAGESPDDQALAGDLTPAGGLAKLGGILAEGRPQDGWAVLGIGLNVAVRLDDLPAKVRPAAATLGEPREAIEPTLTRLLAALGRRLSEPTDTMLEAWRARDVLRGREIAWWAQGPDGRVSGGHAEGIDGEGRLVVALQDGGHTSLDAGEVHLQRP